MSIEKTTEHHFEFDDLEAKLEGVGKDAEVVTNDKGGKQSKTPMALHLVDPQFLYDWADNYSLKAEDIQDSIYLAIREIASYMLGLNKAYLESAMYYLEQSPTKRLIRIAKVLQYGADRYEANNWRLIPQESHINHALIHLVAHLMGDTQDDHLDHALCRLMMAYATEKSEGFDYNKYIPKDIVGSIEEVYSDHPDFRPIQKLQEGYDKFMCKYKYDCHYKENE